jgi:hypothetical protein
MTVIASDTASAAASLMMTPPSVTMSPSSGARPTEEAPDEPEGPGEPTEA